MFYAILGSLFDKICVADEQLHLNQARARIKWIWILKFSGRWQQRQDQPNIILFSKDIQNFCKCFNFSQF